jgi:hypothetical protein
MNEIMDTKTLVEVPFDLDADASYIGAAAPTDGGSEATPEETTFISEDIRDIVAVNGT